MTTDLVILGLVLLSEPFKQFAPTPVAEQAYQFDRLQYRDRVESDGRQIRELDVKVRLGTAQAVAEFGQLGLPYIDGYGDVRFEDVVIEKPDGRRVAVENGRIEDLNPFGVTGTSLPADVRFKRLTIPGLEPGDRLSYVIRNQQQPLAPGRAFGEMKLPPLAGSPLQTYELDLPRDAAVKVRLRDGLGASWEEVPSARDRLVRRLTLKVEPPTSSPIVVSNKDLLNWAEPDVVFTSFDSWSEVSEWWWKISKDRLRPDKTVSEEASRLAQAASSPREQITALHAFLAGRIRYLNVSFGLGRMQPRAAPEVLRDRYGDCKDKHALLAALAESLGLDVRPVLINSFRSDLWDDVPSPQQFDHVISVLRMGAQPSEWLWLDATNPFGGPGHLAPQLRDKRALLIEPSGESVVVRTPVDPPFVPREEVTLTGTLSPEGVLKGRLAWSFRSDAEFALRAFFGALSQENRIPAVKEVLGSDWGEVTLNNVTISDPLNIAAPFRVEVDLEKMVPAKGRERALWVPFAEFNLPEAPESAPTEAPAVRFEVREMSARAEIQIPEGHSADAPLSLTLERPFGTFRSQYSADVRTVKLERSLVLSQSSVAEADVASYESFRKAVQADRKQEFSIALPAEASASAGGADGIHQQAKAAFSKKDFAKAAELFQKATESDPKLKDAFLHWGRALYELERDDDAVAAFSRQIEVTPFHEYAYAWRGHALARLDRWAEAERDLSKQIEVAPFQVWSYSKLADRRMAQDRYDEAADLYARAAAIKPKAAVRWVDLAEAQAQTGNKEKARGSLEKAVALEPTDQLKIRAAVTYHSIGDLLNAADLARKALPWLTGETAAMSVDDVDEGDLYWTGRLADLWRFIGEAASAEGDVSTAERYLEAAWRLEFSPEAGWALGDLREKQGRLMDAVELWFMAAAVPDASRTLPADYQDRIDAACEKLPQIADSPVVTLERMSSLRFHDPRPRRQVAAEARLMDLRTVRPGGPAVAQLTEPVLLLASSEGVVEHVTNLSGNQPEVFDRQIAKLGTIRLNWLRPDERSWKAVRRGLLVCSPATNCALLLDLPGLPDAPSGDLGSIRIESIEPKEGSTLKRGQQVTVRATVRYEPHDRESAVALVVQDDSRRSLLASSISEVAKPGTGELTLTGTFTVPDNANRVDVFLALTDPGRNSTSTVAAVYYKAQ
ncbi:MAG TPA: tetratricopeptide repeat protein [Vicinamibacteria bacterium]